MGFEESVKKSVESLYGLTVSSVFSLKGGVMNSNFKIVTENGDFVFRIYNQTSRTEVEYEMRILQHLAKKNFQAPRVVASKDGELVINYENKPAVLYVFLKGEPLTRLNTDILKKVGRMIGSMHIALGDFTSEHTKENWDPENIRKLIHEKGQVLHTRGLPDAAELLGFLKAEISKYSFKELPAGVTHQDIKPENILVNDDVITGFIDFDNNYYSALIHDLTTTIIWTCFGSDGLLNREYMEAIVAGYEEKRPLTQIEKDSFGDLIRWRLLREIFIGPFVTVGHGEIVVSRANHFRRLYEQLTEKI